MARGPVLSPVDYDAWAKGYMPPSEHILIDQLAYRGARVVASTDSSTSGWWLVMRGERISGKKLFAVYAAIEAALEAQADEKHAAAAEPASPSPHPEGEAQ